MPVDLIALALRGKKVGDETIIGMIDELRQTIALQEELQCHEHVATLLNQVTAIQRNMNDSHRWPVADIRAVVRKLLTNEAQVDSP